MMIFPILKNFGIIAAQRVNNCRLHLSMPTLVASLSSKGAVEKQVSSTSHLVHSLSRILGKFCAASLD
jgi:hypothetical protein